MLAAQIVRRDGTPVTADGLLARMFAATLLSDPMQHLLRGVRAAGLRTALLSNSWGLADYPRHLFPGLFDAVVISAEVGMRKPEERIFRHAAGLLGLEPAQCVFIDDIEANVRGGRGPRDDRGAAREPGRDRPAAGRAAGTPGAQRLTGLAWHRG